MQNVASLRSESQNVWIGRFSNGTFERLTECLYRSQTVLMGRKLFLIGDFPNQKVRSPFCLAGNSFG